MVEIREKREKPNCSKGLHLECITSKNRTLGQLKKLAELSPKINDSIIDIQMFENAASVESQSKKGGDRSHLVQKRYSSTK